MQDHKGINRGMCLYSLVYNPKSDISSVWKNISSGITWGALWDPITIFIVTTILVSRIKFWSPIPDSVREKVSVFSCAGLCTRLCMCVCNNNKQEESMTLRESRKDNWMGKRVMKRCEYSTHIWNSQVNKNLNKILLSILWSTPETFAASSIGYIILCKMRNFWVLQSNHS